MKDHEMRLHYTKLVKYDGTNIMIEEIYSGEELSRKYGKKELRLTNEFAVPEEVARKHQLERGIISRTSKFVSTAVITRDFPPQWWEDYDYPQWTWGLASGGYYVREDPINLAWYGQSVSKDMVKQEIDDPPEDDWYDWVMASMQYIYDRYSGWEEGDDMATEFGLGPRYHIRLWTICTGDIVGSAHHEDTWHNVTSFEDGELRVLDEFDDSILPDIENDVEFDWAVHPGSYWHGNFKREPYNSGYTSEIFRE